MDEFISGASASHAAISKKHSWSAQPSSPLSATRKPSDLSLNEKKKSQHPPPPLPTSSLPPSAPWNNGVTGATSSLAVSNNPGLDSTSNRVEFRQSPKQERISEKGRPLPHSMSKGNFSFAVPATPSKPIHRFHSPSQTFSVSKSIASTSELDLSNRHAPSLKVAQAAYGPSSYEPVAVSLEEEQVLAQNSAPKAESAFSKISKAFRRKSKQPPDSKPSDLRSASKTGLNTVPSARAVRKMPSQHSLAQPGHEHTKAAFAASGFDPRPPIPAKTLWKQPDPPHQASNPDVETSRSLDLSQTNQHRPNHIPFADQTHDSLPTQSIKASTDVPTHSTKVSTDVESVLAPLHFDSTTQALESNGSRQYKQRSSVDSAHSSVRRRSLAFLASAISMSSTDVSTVDQDKNPNRPSTSSESFGRPRKLPSDNAVEPSSPVDTRPPLSNPPVPVSRSNSSASFPQSLSPSINEPTLTSSPTKSRLLPRSATRDDEGSSALTDFLKLDALESTQFRHGQNNAPSGSFTTNSNLDKIDSAEDSRSSAPKARRLSETSRSNDPHSKQSIDDTLSISLSLSRKTSHRSTGAASAGKKSTLSSTSKASRTPKGVFMAPALDSVKVSGPAMEGYMSPFFVPPLSSVDHGVAVKSSRKYNRRASASSRSLTSEGSIKSARSGNASDAQRGSIFKAIANSKSTGKKNKATVSEPLKRFKSQENLRPASANPQPEPVALHADGISPSSANASFNPLQGAPSNQSFVSLEPSLKKHASSSRLRKASISNGFDSKALARSKNDGPRDSNMGGTDQVPFRINTQDIDKPNVMNRPMDGETSPRAQGSRSVFEAARPGQNLLVASPKDSVEFEMLGAKKDSTPVFNEKSTADVNQLAISSHLDDHHGDGVNQKTRRGRSNSAASLDPGVKAGGNAMLYPRDSQDSRSVAVSGRQTGDSLDQRSGQNSRIDSNGGAAALFGMGAPRQRTSSLIPSFGFSRSRTNSTAGPDSSAKAVAATSTTSFPSRQTPHPSLDTSRSTVTSANVSMDYPRPKSPRNSTSANPVAAALAAITAADLASQDALRRRSSFHIPASLRKTSISSKPSDFALDNQGFSDQLDQLEAEYGLVGEDRSVRVSESVSRRSTSSWLSFGRNRPNGASSSTTDLGLSKKEKKSPSNKEYLPYEDELSEEFAQRIATSAPKNQVAAILASSSDEFYRNALKHFMTKFWFSGIPLDIALRKLLMGLHLPKETQQIDRVMEAFAKRFNECNQGLFTSDDQPYILAFSLMMLHTDAFNKNAKNKMTKADYLRNTSPSGVPTEILEYLYDNLIFTQFIYVEDSENQQKRRLDSIASSTVGSSIMLSSFAPGSGIAVANRQKIDPYYLIAQSRLTELRPDFEHLIPEDTPFSYTGSLPSYNIDRLNAAFLHAPSIEIVTSRPSVPPTPSWPNSDSTNPGPVSPVEDEVVILKVTKVGIVSRKDDMADGGRKSGSRKWKTGGLLLTGSQLLLFKDIVWITALQSQILDQIGHSQMSNGIRPLPDDVEENVEGGIVISPKITYFRPDGVISLADTVAVKDSSYSKYDFVFRLLAAKGRQYLVQAQSEDDMNDWIHKINFCASFRAVDIKIRGIDLSCRLSELSRMDSASEAGSSIATRAATRQPSTGDLRSFSSERSRLAWQSQLSFTDMDSSYGFDGQAPSRPASLKLNEGWEEGREDLDDDFIAKTRDNFYSASKSAASSRFTNSNSQLTSVVHRRAAARKELVLSKIEQADAELEKVARKLNDEMRLARHFAILTPFQKSTRDRIEMAAHPLASRIKHLRLDMAKVESRSKILHLDLEAGERVARELIPSLHLSSSFLYEVNRMPLSQLNTPQLLELGGKYEEQAGFEDAFGSGHGRSLSQVVDSSNMSPNHVSRSASLILKSRNSNDNLANSVAGRASGRSLAESLQGSVSINGGSTLTGSRVLKPASHQRNNMHLNSVSEQPYDESPLVENGGNVNAVNGLLVSGSRSSEVEPRTSKGENHHRLLVAANHTTSAIKKASADRLGMDLAEDEMLRRSSSPARSSLSRSSTSIDEKRQKHVSVPAEADEVPEEWDMSKVIGDGLNRISLVDLPSPNELEEVTTRRFVFGVSQRNSTLTDD